MIIRGHARKGWLKAREWCERVRTYGTAELRGEEVVELGKRR